MRKYQYVVKGCGNFPVSLLCIAEAWPSSLGESEKLSFALPTQAREQRIKLTSLKDPASTQQLWTKANWPIQSVE